MIERPFPYQIGLNEDNYVIIDGKIGIGYKRRKPNGHDVVLLWNQQNRLVTISSIDGRIRIYPRQDLPDEELNMWRSFHPNVVSQVFYGEDLSITNSSALSPGGHGLLVQVRSKDEVTAATFSTSSASFVSEALQIARTLTPPRPS